MGCHRRFVEYWAGRTHSGASLSFVTQTELRSAQAASFGAAAGIYERARPSYPDEALDWLLPKGNPRVLDLGAGTGKLTRLIAARGIDVEAVDPSEGMLAELKQVLPEVPVHLGTAERIPVADGTFDAVLVAQAWHWVDVPRASVEAGRVLRPGGRLGLIWNDRDDRVDWVSELSAITTPHDVRTMQSDNPWIGRPFGQIEYFVTEWTHEMTPASLIDLIASRSYMIVAPEPERVAVLAAVQDLLDNHPDLAGRDRFEMPYVTYASRAHIA
jgi:SAM-dependent methyltransferase